MKNNLEMLNTNGLQCDNPKCGWEDDTIKLEDYEQWLNKPCPKCGENVLTQEDFDNVQLIVNAMAFINTLSPEELEEFGEMSKQLLSEEDLKKFEGFNPEDEVITTLNTHGKISIDKVRKSDEK